MADRESNHRLNQSQQSSRRSLRRSSIFATLICSSLLTLSGTGCSMFSGIHNSWEYNDCCNDFMLGYRNRAWSARAWHEHKQCYKNRKHLRDFCRGFRQGYEDVASGKDGCTPAFPPREYWGWKYQSPEGQAKVNAWFSGYPMGAKAAEEDGLGNYSQIQTSGQMEYQFQQHGLMAAPTPIAQSQPNERLPGLDGLLAEGESIVGDVKVEVDASSTGSPVTGNTSPSAPSHIPMPPPMPVMQAN